MNDRHYNNPYDDFDSSKPTNLWIGFDPNGKVQLIDLLTDKWHRNIEWLKEEIEKGLSNQSSDDPSVYTGNAGIALMYLHIDMRLGSNSLLTQGYQTIFGNPVLEKSCYYLSKSLEYYSKHPSSKPTFLCGQVGAFAIAAVLYERIGKKQLGQQYLNKVVDAHKDVLKSTSMPFELLNGVAGYISALLFVRKYVGPTAVPNHIFKSLVDKILHAGVEGAKAEKGDSPPLVFYWHDSFYFGAAHGLAGILTILMQVPEFNCNADAKRLVLETMEYMRKYRFKSGNYPSSPKSANNDKLVHWCHGAPGWIHAFALAYQIYKLPEFLEEAKACADVIWSRGLLKKGHGLCHGTSGNGYAFLKMYQITNDLTYLYRAIKFAEFILVMHWEDFSPDRPYSLFEGRAGSVYYLADMFIPEEATFPAFY